MDTESLIPVLEAILFASGDPVSVERLEKALDTPADAILEALRTLQDRLAYDRAGIRLSQMEDAWQFTTAPEHAAAVRKALETRRPPSLSGAALEVLAIVAYRGPVTRAFVEKVRGVDSTYTVSSLCDRGILEEAGRLEVPGRPILYRLSAAALRILGISSLSELPPLPEDTPLPETEAGADAPADAPDTPEGEMPADMPAEAPEGEAPTAAPGSEAPAVPPADTAAAETAEGAGVESADAPKSGEDGP